VRKPDWPQVVPPLRTPSLRTLTPLAVLAAALLLGWGGQARAGYVTTASLADDPGMAGASQTALDATSAESPSDGEQILLPSAWTSPSALLHSDAPTTGAGGQPAPDGPGAGGPHSQTTAASRPQVDPPTLVGVLFLGDTERRPPPFPSRLFRPPRHA